MKKNSLIVILIVVLILLLIPLIAMQFTNEVSWAILDFVIMGVLLLSTGLVCEYVLRKVSKFRYRIFFIMAILIIFLLVWAELAVGIFGTPFAGN